MANGGKRAGAGRPKGAALKRSEEAMALAASYGISPLQVMLEAMVHYYQKAKTELAMKVPDNERLDAAFRQASDHAKDAAPYVHPKLANVEHTGANGGPIQMQDMLNDFGDLTRAEREVFREILARRISESEPRPEGPTTH